MKTNTSRIGTLRGKPCSGFTLVELLVTITIIIVLASLVFVVTGKIRNNAYQANAMSSLRQVATASVAYSTENNGDINTLRWVGDPKEGTGGYVKNSFWGRLQPQLFGEMTITSDQKKLKDQITMRLDGLFNTDTAAGGGADKRIPMPGTILTGSRIYRDGSGLPIPIAFNNNLHKWGEFLKVSSFSDPSNVIYAVYGSGFFNEADGQAYAERPTNNTKPANNIYYLDNRKALATFLDGHIEMLSAPIPERNYK